MIELQNISKRLGQNQVLNGVSLSVSQGETLVIVGSSGTGKSVTLKHMMGLLKPDDGDLLIDGQSIANARGRNLEALRQKFGVLFQSGALINWLTIADNIALPLLEKTKMKDKAIRARVDEVLQLVELEGAGGKYPSEISGGMKKRAGLARAIVLKPEILLYDEPTSGLDPILSRKIDHLIATLSKSLGVTSVVVTHDMVSAFGIADRIAMLDKGQVIAEGTPEEFRQSQNPVVREFIAAQMDPDTWKKLKGINL